MHKYIIDRQTWLHGEGTNNYGEDRSCLLRPKDGKMCCLGQVLKQEGFKDNDIYGIDAPSALTSDNIKKLPKWLETETDKWGNTYKNPEIMMMMMTNDSGDISGSEREDDLIRLAAKMDVELEFVN